MPTPTICRRCGSTSSGEWSGELCAACLLEFAWLDYEPPPGMETLDAASPGVTAAPTSFAGYQLLGELASGGMGVVYRALQVRLNRPVALKMIRAGRLARAEDRARFRVEAETAARLQHPNIVAIHEVGEQAGQPFFSMELIEGWSLAEMVRQHPLRPDQAARYVRTIAEAIQFAHERGVLHRDLKPSNVLVDGNDEPHVTDFGLAKVLADDSGLTHTGAVLGSPSYMAPEQARGRNDAVDVRTDVYALGAILYELLTGRPPFRASSAVETLRLVMQEEPVPPRALNPGLPRDLETICLRCLAKAVEARYPTAREVSEELGRFLEDRPILARPAGAGEKLVRWCRREPALAGSLGCVLILLTALAAVSVVAAMRLKKEAAVTQAAREVAEERLQAAELQRAHAERLSGMAGRRLRSLAAIQAAARVRPTLALRNEAIAALGLMDLGRPLLDVRSGDPAAGGRVTFDSSIERFATLQPGGKVAVRRVSDRSLLSEFPAPALPVGGMRFSPDGRYLGADLGSGSVLVWDWERGALVWRSDRRENETQSEFSRQGDAVLMITPDRQVRMFDLSTGVERSPLSLGAPAQWLALNAKGDWLAVGCSDQVQLWSVTNSLRIRVLPTPTRAHALGWGRDNQHVALGLASGEVVLWDLLSDRRLTLAAHSSDVLRLGYDVGGERIWTAGFDGLSRFWDALNGSLQLTTAEGLACQVSPDGQRVAYVDSASHFGVWEAVRSRSFRTFPVGENENELLNASLSGDGRWLAVGASGGWHLLDTTTGRELANIRTGRRMRMAMHPRDPVVAGLTMDDIRRWTLTWHTNREGISLSVGEASTVFAGPKKELQRMAFSPDGRWLGVAGHHRSLVLSWGNPSDSADFSQGYGQSFVSLSPDHRWVAAADVFGLGATVWDLRQGTLLQNLIPREHVHLAFSPDGHTLATMARQCVLWDTETWRPRREIPIQPGFVGSGNLAFSGDGKLLGVVEAYRAIKLLDVETGDEVATLTPPVQLNLTSIEVSADGQAVAAVTQGRTVYFWDLRALRAELAELGLNW